MNKKIREKQLKTPLIEYYFTASPEKKSARLVWQESDLLSTFLELHFGVKSTDQKILYYF
jgi:hypothetical protein